MEQRDLTALTDQKLFELWEVLSNKALKVTCCSKVLDKIVFKLDKKLWGSKDFADYEKYTSNNNCCILLVAVHQEKEKRAALLQSKRKPMKPMSNSEKAKVSQWLKKREARLAKKIKNGSIEAKGWKPEKGDWNDNK